MAVDDLGDIFERRNSESGTLQAILSWAQDAVSSTDAGIFVARGPGFESVVSTSERVSQADALQQELEEGPALQVIGDEALDGFVIGDTAEDPRFPEWGPQAADLGLRSVISVVLATPRRLGALSVYSSEPHAFDRDDLSVIDIFSRRAARAITVARENEGMVLALDSRKVIGQAQGILMERLNIDADAAFTFLIRESQHRNVKLRAVADWIVTHRGDRKLSDLDL